MPGAARRGLAYQKVVDKQLNISLSFRLAFNRGGGDIGDLIAGAGPAVSGVGQAQKVWGRRSVGVDHHRERRG